MKEKVKEIFKWVLLITMMILCCLMCALKLLDSITAKREYDIIADTMYQYAITNGGLKQSDDKHHPYEYSFDLPDGVLYVLYIEKK